MKKILPIFLCSLIISGCKIDESVATQAQRTLARNDVVFMTQTILENHPGPKNDLDPAFKNILHEAHETALAEAAQVRSEQEHINMIKKYVKHFNCAHLNAFSKEELASSVRRKEKEPVNKNFSLRDWMPNCLWVTIPTFELEGEKQTCQLKNIIEKLPEYRDYKAIVFDVRGNTGGNSLWGSKLVAALCGEDYRNYKRKELVRNVYVEWRLSKDNLEHIRKIVDRLKEIGIQNEILEEEEETFRNMTKALANGASLFAEHPQTKKNSDTNDVIPVNKCHAKIIAIIDRSCASACLDFLDELKMIEPPALFVGQMTGADSLYMDLRRVELPSKIGYLTIPLKVYRNRPRGNNEPYKPDIAYEGDLKDTAVVETWLRAYPKIPAILKSLTEQAI